MGIGHSAQETACVAQRVHGVLRSAHRARQEIIVTTEVLGARMNYQVGAQLEGAEVERSAEGAVDNQLEARVLSANGDQAPHVDDAQVRVGRCFGEDDAGRAGPDRSLERVDVVRVDQGVLDTEATEERGHELTRAPIAIRRHHDVIARAHHRKKKRGDGVHPAREEHRVLGPFERGELALGGANGGVAVAPVFFARDVPLEMIANFARCRRTCRSPCKRWAW